MRSIRNVRQIVWAAGLGSLVSFGSWLSEAEEVWISRQVLTNVAQFYRAVGAEHQANYAAQLEGVICWADSDQKSFVLEDDSGAVFVKAHFEGAPIRLGSRVRLEGDCAAQRTGLAVGMTEALVVDNDGLHVPSWETGVVFLKAGFNPIRLAWFNSKGDGLLNASQEAGDQVLEVRTGSQVHRARLHTSLWLMKPIPIGSRLALTGIYLGKGGNWAAGQDIEGFDLVLNSPADIEVLEKPSWWTPRRLLGLAGSLSVILILALGWIRVLHRQVEERTRQLAQQIQARERLERQRALEEERTRLARDLHDDLGGGLTEISMLGSLATDRALPSDRRTGYLAQMTEKARELVGALDEIVWAVNPRYNSLSSLTAYYSLYAQRFLSLASLRCRLEVAPDLPDASLDSTVRHSLFLAFKEALNNVVRHAQASEVRLRILAEAEELIVSVADNGRGLSPGVTAASGMDGLANMRARLSAMGGRCEVQSVPAQGTIVILGVRLPRQNHDQSSHS